MSLVDAPSPTPSPSTSSPETVGPVAAGAPAVAGIDQHITEEKNVPTAADADAATTAAIPVAKTLAPAPNGKTPTPLPTRPRVEPAEPSSPMAPPSESSTPAPSASASEPPPSAASSANASAESTPAVAPDAVAPVAPALDEAVPPSTGAPAAAAAESVAATAATTVTAAVEGVDGSSEPAEPLVTVSDLKDALAAVAATEGGGAGAREEEVAQGTADGAESAEEEASTNSLKDDPGTPEECNLFVGDLARNLTEEKLEKAFEQHGKVMSVSIKRDRATGKNLGYGFVKLSSHQEARAAKEAMQGVELGGRRVRVGWAQKNTSLYVTGLEAGGTITTEMLVREFARFGPLDKELTAIKPGAKVGFVKYRYRLHAETAKKELHDKPAFGGLCPSVQIEWNSVESSTQGGSDPGGSDKGTEDRAGGTAAGGKDGGGGRGRASPGAAAGGAGGAHLRAPRGEPSSNAVHVQFEGEQSRVSSVNEVMIRKCFTKWEPLVDIVIPPTRFNGVSPNPRQLPRCWGVVHFPPTPEGERAAADAIKSLNGTTISELRV
ncbi:unnamed protein product, partial [Scytosiphon promiscuus]